MKEKSGSIARFTNVYTLNTTVSIYVTLFQYL